MATRNVFLENDENCPYCDTLVHAGQNFCPSCGARYVAVYREWLTPIVFFLFGWWLGDILYEPGKVLLALFVAIGGSLWVKDYANENPRWRRGSW